MARKSPRKSSEKSSNPSIISNRKARHCRICEGRPLKSECSCTRNPDGTRRIQPRQNKHVTAMPSRTTSSHLPVSNSQVLDHGTTLPMFEMQLPSSPLLPLPAPAPPQTWSPAHEHVPLTTNPGTTIAPTSPTTPTHRHLPAIPVFQLTTAPTFQPTGAVTAYLEVAATAVHSKDINPLGTSGPAISMPDFGNHTPNTSTRHGTPSTGVSNLTGGSEGARNEANSDEDSDSSSDSGVELHTPTRKKKLYTSRLHAQLTPEYQKARHSWKKSRATRKPLQNMYGKVSGSMQGSMPLGILRKRPLRPALIDQASSIQRFGREIRSIFHKAERLSVQTSSYIFIGAQHPNSRKAFVHYSSDRLRADAIKDTENVVHKFAGVINRLNAVQKANAEASQRKLHDTENAFLLYKEQARKELEAAQDALHAKDKEASYLREMLCQTQRHTQTGVALDSQSVTLPPDINAV